jgi:hypothetical protein
MATMTATRPDHSPTRALLARIASSLACAGVLLTALPASAQQLRDLLSSEPFKATEGWQGFLDLAFLGNMTLMLALAAALGFLIGHHPRHLQAADTLEELEAQKVHVLYAVIGAVIGILVVQFGLVVGFVVFGIGGLIRFRTILRSASVTGMVIFSTLVGLSCGLDLPHVAVLTTAFGFVLIYFLEGRTAYRIDIKSLPRAQVSAAAQAYRALLEAHGCIIVREKKNPSKERVTLIFRCKHSTHRDELEELLATKIDASLKGSVDWEVD